MKYKIPHLNRRKTIMEQAILSLLISLLPLVPSVDATDTWQVGLQFTLRGSEGSFDVYGTVYRSGDTYTASVRVWPTLDLTLKTEYRIGLFHSVLSAVTVSDIGRKEKVSLSAVLRSSWQGGAIDLSLNADTDGNIGAGSSVQLSIDLGNIGAIDYRLQQLAANIPGQSTTSPIEGSIKFGSESAGGTLSGSLSGTLYSSGELFANIKLGASIFGNVNANDPSVADCSGSSYWSTAVGGVVVAVDKLGLLAPYIGLVSTTIIATVATVIYVKRVKHRKEKQ
jgi:hypothetical protein